MKTTRSRMQTMRIMRNMSYIFFELDVTLNEAAKKSGLDHGYRLSDYKIYKAEIPDEVLFKIAGAYDLDVE